VEGNNKEIDKGRDCGEMGWWTRAWTEGNGWEGWSAQGESGRQGEKNGGRRTAGISE